MVSVEKFSGYGEEKTWREGEYGAKETVLDVFGECDVMMRKL